MDPITTAIIAALAGLSKDVIQDSYNALKAALKKKFGAESDVAEAVEKLEKKPDSDGRKAMLQEEIELVKANDDPEIVQLAQALLKQMESKESGPSKFKVEFQGEVKGVQIGDHNVQENTFN